MRNPMMIWSIVGLAYFFGSCAAFVPFHHPQREAVLSLHSRSKRVAEYVHEVRI